MHSWYGWHGVSVCTFNRVPCHVKSCAHATVMPSYVHLCTFDMVVMSWAMWTFANPKPIGKTWECMLSHVEFAHSSRNNQHGALHHITCPCEWIQHVHQILHHVSCAPFKLQCYVWRIMWLPSHAHHNFGWVWINKRTSCHVHFFVHSMYCRVFSHCCFLTIFPVWWFGGAWMAIQLCGGIIFFWRYCTNKLQQWPRTIWHERRHSSFPKGVS